MKNESIVKSDSSVDRHSHNEETVELISIQNLKSIYYWLNAKPDTQIKIFDIPKLVTIGDIITLNRLLQKKLENHDLFTNITQVDIILNNGDVFSFGAWEEFLNSKWEVPNLTQTITVSWDINLKLPKYEMPQRHTIKIRMGSPMRFDEFFQMMTNSDNDVELRTGMSPIICKVDFINDVISSELMQIVENWYKCLPKLQQPTKFQQFIDNQKQVISRGVHYLLILTALTILYFIFRHQINGFQSITLNKDLVLSSYLWILITLSTYYLSNITGAVFAKNVYKTIDKIDGFPIFNITRGDINLSNETKGKNQKIVSRFLAQLFFAVIGAVLSVILGNYFSS